MKRKKKLRQIIEIHSYEMVFFFESNKKFQSILYIPVNLANATHANSDNPTKNNPSILMSDANPSIPMNGSATVNRAHKKMKNAGIINPGTI